MGNSNFVSIVHCSLWETTSILVSSLIPFNTDYYGKHWHFSSFLITMGKNWPSRIRNINRLLWVKMGTSCGAYIKTITMGRWALLVFATLTMITIGNIGILWLFINNYHYGNIGTSCGAFIKTTHYGKHWEACYAVFCANNTWLLSIPSFNSDALSFCSFFFHSFFSCHRCSIPLRIGFVGLLVYDLQI